MVQRVGVSFPNIVEINEDELLSYLENKTLGNLLSCSIFIAFLILKYKSSLLRHRDFVIAWIKEKTNTLSVYEEGDDIYINYLLDNDADKNK